MPSVYDTKKMKVVGWMKFQVSSASGVAQCNENDPKRGAASKPHVRSQEPSKEDLKIAAAKQLSVPNEDGRNKKNCIPDLAGCFKRELETQGGDDTVGRK
ncbi:unnamed protein product [Pleuronectes platessa]|uniref:Uncharacterized protein n=1 Tax=Pleuronectes platessa TaxID=8262 RepID=A0A9N7VE05_PLEPL|nr:unnamed protein product [Pleuronectes platessa]